MTEPQPSLFAARAMAEHGPTCCDFLKRALRANAGDGTPKGLRRRAMVDENGQTKVLVLYAIGREDVVVAHCPFCGAKQAEP